MSFRDVTKSCEYCGNPLQLNNARDIDRKRFCSHACRQRWRYEHGDHNMDAMRARAYSPEAITKRNLPKGPKGCLHCNQTFNPDSARQQYCKACVPTKAARHRMRRYGISQTEWDTLVIEQHGTCALCNDPPYAVDHCHKTGAVRGLLCDNCNRLLGKIESGSWADWYVKATAYLDR